MKRFLAAILSVLAISAVFVSCGETVTLDVEVAADALHSNITYEDDLQVLDSGMLVTTYPELKTEDVVKSKVYTSSAATTEEIAVFEAKDAEAADRIEAAMKARVTAQKELYESYAPGEAARVEKAVIAKKGNYVVFCVAGDPAKAQSEIDKLF